MSSALNGVTLKLMGGGHVFQIPVHHVISHALCTTHGSGDSPFNRGRVRRGDCTLFTRHLGRPDRDTGHENFSRNDGGA